MNNQRRTLLLWLALLSSCTTYGAPGYHADALSADDPYWRDAAEDPLGCADTESCRIAGLCASINIAACHAWHDEDCKVSTDCAEAQQDGPCCWLGFPGCSVCGVDPYGQP